MDLLSELSAPMFLISPPLALQTPSLHGNGDGSSVAGAGGGDLSLGLDLSSIAWDLCDLAALPAAAAQNQSIDLAAGIEALPGTVSIEDTSRPTLELNSCDPLDFELTTDFWATLDHFSEMSPEAEISPDLTLAEGEMTNWSPINSPSEELTFSNLLGPMTSAAASLMAASPESVSFEEEMYSPSSSESSSAEGAKSGSRRTRARKIDKKQSNKAAAIRYRSKKLKERETLFAECAEYQKKNAELKKKIEDTQTEISFIKSLLVEALMAKRAK